MAEDKIKLPEELRPDNWKDLTPDQQKLYDEAYGKGAQTRDQKVTELQQQLKNTLGQLTNEGTKTKLTTEELEKAKTRLRELEEQGMSVEEKHQRALLTLKEQHNVALGSAKKEAERWKGLHNSETIRRALSDAAIKNDAYRPEQVVTLLFDTIQIEEITEEGKPPQFKLTMPGKGKDGVAVPVSVEDGVKTYLTENPNLVRGMVVPGQGGNFQSGSLGDGSTITREQLADPAFVRKNWDQISVLIQRGAKK